MKSIVMIIGIVFMMRCALTPESNIIIGDSLTHRNTWNIDNYSRGGNTIQDLTNGIDNFKNYDNVYILIGINDMCLGSSKEKYLYELSELVDSINGNVYIISILPIDNIFTWGNNIDIKDINEELSLMYNYINVYDSLINDSNINPYTIDGLHLTDEGYSIFENILYPLI